MADDLASTLAEAKRRHLHGHTSNPRRDYCTGDNQDWPCDAWPLLAALEAVLKLADESAVMTCRAPGRQGPTSWTLDPAEVREAITTALGEEAGDGG